MIIDIKRYMLVGLSLMVSMMLLAEQYGQTCTDDGTNQIVEADSVSAVSHDNIIKRIINYFGESNKIHRDKALDITFLAGPHYSVEKKFGIGLLAAGVYSTARYDTLTPLSNASVYADISTSGYYSIGIRGTTRFPRDKYRINVDAYFSSIPDKFWGIGYVNNVNSSNEANYKRLEIRGNLDFLAEVYPQLYVGPLLEMTYMKGNPNDENRYLWNDERLRTFSCAVGAKVSYDIRDNLTAPNRGVYVLLAQKYYGRWIGNTSPFMSTDLRVCWYTPMWKGSVLATQFHALYTYGRTPWSMLAYVGGSYNMRGYYEGRYRDKGEMDAVVELRQHVYRRVGVVLWGGAATIFPKLNDVTLKHVLPNYGAGLRWEFKKNVNVRFDVGIGRNEWGVVFNINEAF